MEAGSGVTVAGSPPTDPVLPLLPPEPPVEGTSPSPLPPVPPVPGVSTLPGVCGLLDTQVERATATDRGDEDADADCRPAAHHKRGGADAALLVLGILGGGRCRLALASAVLSRRRAADGQTEQRVAGPQRSQPTNGGFVPAAHRAGFGGGIARTHREGHNCRSYSRPACHRFTRE